MTDFIGVYDDVLSAEDCKRLIKKFERSREKVPGKTGHGLNRAAKDSMDITLSQGKDWAEEDALITRLTEKGLLRYIRQYPHLLSGAVTIYFPDPQTGQQTPIDDKVINVLDDATLLQLQRKIYRLGTVNLQRYTRQSGGYHHFHSEHFPAPDDPSQASLHRVLLFMYYLNDVREGGETEFLYQGRKLRPTRGQLVFAPSGFTHTHKGHVPMSNDKYILTSWVLYHPAEVIYAHPGVQQRRSGSAPT